MRILSRIVMLKAMCAIGLCLPLGVTVASTSPEKQIEIVVINGRNGKPMPNERLLVFFGNSDAEVRNKQHHVDLRTDARGIAVLMVKASAYSRIQVWVDRRSLCQDDPNSRTFDLDEIRRTGVRAPNNCGNVPPEELPSNHFVLFARPATLREKMGW